MDHKVQSKWVWINALIFGLLAGLIKAVFFPYPEYNPPAIYPAVLAFLITALLWWWLMIGSDRMTMLRGGIIGAVVGLLTPVLVWPIFLLILGVTENRFTEIFFWSPVYMYLTLTRIGWITVMLGGVLGAFLAKSQRN